MSKKIQEKQKVTTVKAASKTKIDMVFGKENYILAAVAFAVVFIGFLLLFGSKIKICRSELTCRRRRRSMAGGRRRRRRRLGRP